MKGLTSILKHMCYFRRARSFSLYDIVLRRTTIRTWHLPCLAREVHKIVSLLTSHLGL